MPGVYSHPAQPSGAQTQGELLWMATCGPTGWGFPLCSETKRRTLPRREEEGLRCPEELADTALSTQLSSLGSTCNERSPPCTYQH